MCSQGMVQFVSRFAEPGDAEYAPPVVEGETPVRCVFCLITCQGFVFYVLIMLIYSNLLLRGCMRTISIIHVICLVLIIAEQMAQMHVICHNSSSGYVGTQ